MRLGHVVLLWALGASACVSSDAVHCEGDVTCPAGDTCVAVDSVMQCATPAQVAACDGVPEGGACSLEGTEASTCIASACFPTVCGDNRTDPSETCDDGNTQPGDGCSSDCRSSEICGNGIVDPLRIVDGVARVAELCDDGNLLSGDGCSSGCAVETPQWSLLDATAPPLSEHSMAYDSARRRIVMFGGATNGTNAPQDVHGTHEWDGTRWFTLDTVVSPAARDHAQMAYDPVRHRTLLFGGAPARSYGASFGDTWEWDGTSWWVRSPAHHPSPRAGGTLVYDAAHKRMVLFGGRGPGADAATDVTLDETWTWDGNDWTQLDAGTHPGKRYGHVGGYDPTRGIVVIAGGQTYDEGSYTYPGDTWELDGDVWTLRGTSPALLDMNAAMAWDPAGQRLITYGGTTGLGDATPMTWGYSAGTWSPLGDVSPGALIEPMLASDPVARTVVMYGGISNNATADTWSWNGSAWSLIPPPVAPPYRAFAAAASDPERGLAWVFGGSDETDTAKATLMSFDGSTWTTYPPSGTPPSARMVAAAAYDQARRELVVFGGVATLAGSPVAAETFVWNGTWSKRTTNPAPSPRTFAAMAYDPRHDRIVLYGGADATTMALDDTWAWDGTEWQQLTTTGTPGGLFAPVLVYDDVRGTLLAQGGYDVWQLDDTTWTKLDASSPLPARFAQGAAYDPVARGIVIQGGLPQSDVPLEDTWLWNGSWLYVATSTTPAARAEQVMVPSTDGAGVMMYGGRAGLFGQYSPANYADTWSLSWVSSTARESCVTNVDLDKDGLAGCADPDCWYACTPLCPPEAVGCDSAAPSCGDGTCNTARENCRICPDDCTCTTTVCGDSFCDVPETPTTCPGDCTP